MSEENNKPKATLIKHVVNPTEHNKEQKSPAKEPEAKPKAPAEKRRVVVVKKKVVVVKPQARKELKSPRMRRRKAKKRPPRTKVPRKHLKRRRPLLKAAQAVWYERPIAILGQRTYPLLPCIMVRSSSDRPICHRFPTRD